MRKILALSFTAAMMAPAALPQDTQKATMAFSDPLRPRKLVVETMFGSVTVRGYNGQEAVVETTGRAGIRGPGRREKAGAIACCSTVGQMGPSTAAVRRCSSPPSTDES